ncbi:MAG: TGS domain-containing protein [Deltaproteobacteria bacterium]|nr:TGS domain-containing protein [Deltaproteobacteria bacterium]
MPANLTPQYLEAEAKFKQAKSVPEKIKALEVMMAIIPKHKGTERLRGQLKSRMAKLKEEQQKRPTVSKAEQAYNVKKEGAAQVVLLGLPNVGKSNLFTHLTHAISEVADYPFTTQKPIPGMMRFENLQIQLVDTPPIQMDRIESGFPNLLRNANGFIIVLDLTDDPVFQMEVILEELNRMKIRGGDRDSADLLEQGWVFKKALLLGNKADLKDSMNGLRVLEDRFKNEWMILPVSAKEEMNFEEVKKEVYSRLDILRVYTKIPGKDADRSEPVILKKGSTIDDVALSVHKDFAAKLKYARVWGSGKFDGQMVKRDYRVSEGDVIELHI